MRGERDASRRPTEDALFLARAWRARALAVATLEGESLADVYGIREGEREGQPRLLFADVLEVLDQVGHVLVVLVVDSGSGRRGRAATGGHVIGDHLELVDVVRAELVHDAREHPVVAKRHERQKTSCSLARVRAFPRQPPKAPHTAGERSILYAQDAAHALSELLGLVRARHDVRVGLRVSNEIEKSPISFNTGDPSSHIFSLTFFFKT